jgi:hypothetical protein
MEPQIDSESLRASTLMKAVIFIGLQLLYWCVAVAVLWWAYDMSPLVRGGFYNYSRALQLVMGMGLVLTIPTCVIWLLRTRRHQASALWKDSWSVTWQTFVCMCAYLAIVLIRRQLWRPGQGINDNEMFLPLVGHLNAAFMSGAGWLSFLLQVIPLTCLVSGLLFCAQRYMDRRLARGDSISS